MTTIQFADFGLMPEITKSLTKMGYTTPTPIQAKAIPLALEGRDILGSAQTGTGKTAAFSIPLVQALLKSPTGMAIVLTPTRELAKQVLDSIYTLVGPNSALKAAFLIGGESMDRQFSQLRARPRIIVGTPGRINDHLDRGSLKLGDAGFLVLDETDRMLDMGFGIQIDKILKFLPAKRQTLMFSATLPEGIIRMSSKYLNNPERVAMGATNVIATNIKQDVIRIDQEGKYKELVEQLYKREGSVIVFTKTKFGAEKMAKNLVRDGFKADALHGDLRQSKRSSVMNNFQRKNFRILVATDIAARGLDVPHIEHVINYDLPQVAEDYIHRMGRTARAGAEGSALCFISPQDNMKWRAIERLLDPSKVQSKGGSKNGGDRAPRGGERSYKGASNGNNKPFEGRSARSGDGNGKPFEGRPARSGDGNGKPFEGRPARSGDGNGKPFEGRPARAGDGNGKPAFGGKKKPFHRGANQNRGPNANGAANNNGGQHKPQQKTFSAAGNKA